MFDFTTQTARFHLHTSGGTTFISAFIIFHSYHLLIAGAIPGLDFCLFSNVSSFLPFCPIALCFVVHFLQEGLSHLNAQRYSLLNVSGVYKQKEKDLEKQTPDLSSCRTIQMLGQKGWQMIPVVSQGRDVHRYNQKGKITPRTLQKLWLPTPALSNFHSEQ